MKSAPKATRKLSKDTYYQVTKSLKQAIDMAPFGLQVTDLKFPNDLLTAALREAGLDINSNEIVSRGGKFYGAGQSGITFWFHEHDHRAKARGGFWMYGLESGYDRLTVNHKLSGPPSKFTPREVVWHNRSAKRLAEILRRKVDEWREPIKDEPKEEEVATPDIKSEAPDVKQEAPESPGPFVEGRMATALVAVKTEDE